MWIFYYQNENFPAEIFLNIYRKKFNLNTALLCIEYSYFFLMIMLIFLVIPQELIQAVYPRQQFVPQKSVAYYSQKLDISGQLGFVGRWVFMTVSE